MPDTILDANWIMNERGNTWVTDGEGDHYFIAPLSNGLWLEVRVAQDDYPGFRIATTEEKLTIEQVRDHIQDHFAGWYVRKNNIGLVVDGDDTVADLLNRPVHLSDNDDYVIAGDK